MIPTPYVYVKSERGVRLNVAQFPLAPWARWIAANQDGLVYQYEHEPAASMPYWWIAPGRQSYVGIIDLAGVDWRQTLTPVEPLPVLFMYGDVPTRPETVLGWQLAQLDIIQLRDVADQLIAADARAAHALLTWLTAKLLTQVSAEEHVASVVAACDDALLEAVAQHLAQTARPKADYLADALEAERERLRLHPAMATPLPTGE